MSDDREHMLEAQALARQGKLREAAERYQAVLRQRVDVHALHELAVILGQLGFAAAATEALEKTTELAPDFAEAHRNLGVMYSRADRMADALRCYRRSAELRPDLPEAHSSLLLMLHYQHPYDPAAVAQAHRAFGERFADPLGAAASPHDNRRDPLRRLRIGYVSPDFREHPVAHFIEPALANHHADAFEIVCYSDTASEDAVTARLQSLPLQWRDIRALDHAALADQIRADKVDILIDLAGHTGNNRLLAFARRPAPVQVSFLGCPATTGLRAIDFRITDALADPPGMTESLWTEQLIRLGRTAWCYRPPVNSPPPRSSSQAGPITFGCFGRLAKYSPQAIALWQKILAALPGSRLILKSHGLDRPAARTALEQAFPGRVELLPQRDTLRAHLETYHRIDIALDTFPCHGTTTTCEALWMGVPVISLAGDAHISRVGVSLLAAAGRADLVAIDPAQYVQIAARLAADPKHLASLRNDLRSHLRASPLMNEQSFVAGLEAAYRTMWERWCGPDERVPDRST